MKQLCVAIALLLTMQSAKACDICGCSGGALFIGPYPYFQKHFMGVRHSVRTYFSRMADDPGEFSKDRYQSTEIWGGFSFARRWQLMALLPYNNNLQEMEAHPHAKKGLGDITLLANYQVVNKKKNQLWIGGGIKLPTGEFDPGLDYHPVPNANLQPGSGSVDFIVNVSDVLQLNKWSLHGNANYKMNGTRKDFRFGNRVNASALLSRAFGTMVSFHPFAGLQYEQLQANKLEKIKIDDTGGQALLSTVGMDVQAGKINMGANMQLPVAQNFSNHQTDIRWRGMVQVSFVF